MGAIGLFILRSTLISYGSSVDIAITEGPINLNWGPIMKQINENPFEFFQHDGWSFLGGVTGVFPGVEVRPSFLLSRL